MTHYSGGHSEGVFGATPFEVLYQLLLGLLKYFLESSNNYRTIPKDWGSFFKKRSCPEVPNRDSEANETGLPPVDLTDPDQPSSRKRAKKTNVTITTTGIRTNFQKYVHWQKLRPPTCSSTRNVFAKLQFEKNARYINSHLERQSDRNIPKLSYRSGLTALSKMSGQEIPGLCLLTIFSMGGMLGPENTELEKDFT